MRNRPAFYVSLIFLLCLGGCSHYFVNTGSVGETSFDTRFLGKQGVTITEIHRDSLTASHDGFANLMVISEEPSVLWVYDEEGYYIMTDDKTIILKEAWSDFVAENKDEPIAWYITRLFKMQTSSRSYLLLYFTSSVNSLREYYLPMVIDTTNPNATDYYTLPLTLCSDTAAFGDFNSDSYVDYAEINESLSRVELSTLREGEIIKNNSVWLDLRSFKNTGIFSAYKVRHCQKHAAWRN